ncbi:unnamed protein product [Euphydryas editha]|uniref:Uncharacterized protein n=1 Tax=Euphydryas editha TaxID=104508 RepID=A0AAU9UX66_EUPED|nr:unnamed protein product [Euphydryas editha]
MKQQQINRFKSKFNLLNSQESSEKIVWSCSDDSSDYENDSSYNEINLKPGKRKRKQVKNKKKSSINTSNLDVTIVDCTEKYSGKRSPKSSNVLDVGCNSPILTSSQRYFAPFASNKSPVLNLSSKENKQVSPLLVLKNSSRKCLPKVKKKLFDCNNSINVETNREKSMSPVLTCTENVLKKSKTSVYQNISNSITNDEDRINIDRKINNNQHSNTNVRKDLQNEDYQNINDCEKQELKFLNHLEDNADITIDNTIKSVALIDKVKSYFDSHFSSTSQSQHSISEYDSKSSPKSNEDIEIINSLMEKKNSPNLKLENNSSDSLRSYDDVYVHKTKKVKYKKDGLAFRLNVLLKKQNASTSLWYHERFLASNSNFVVPKEEFMAFRIEKVSFKYGCYLLNVLDVNDEFCLIFINNLYVKSNSIERNAIFKLYKPYKLLEFDGYKLYINVCKYECIVLKK